MRNHEDTIELLEAIGLEIGAESKAGNRKAQDVISMYEMYYRLSEPVALTLLNAKIDEYLADKKSK